MPVDTRSPRFNGGRQRAAVVCLCLAALQAIPVSQATTAPPSDLPAAAARQLADSLSSARRHREHVWRDTPALNGDGTITAYIEIARGDRRKWEFDMAMNARAIDRVMPATLGGYPVNYGFVPQTISYDGDPFDALVIGPPISGGRVVRGAVIGLMLMEDEKGIDSKAVLAPVGPDGRPRGALTDAIRGEIAEYFRKYKRHEPGKFSQVPGWGSPQDGRAFVEMTHAFFRECRSNSETACRVRR